MRGGCQCELGNPSHIGSGLAWTLGSHGFAMGSEAASSDEKFRGIWNMLPSFDPSQDDVKEQLHC